MKNNKDDALKKTLEILAFNDVKKIDKKNPQYVFRKFSARK